MKEIIFDSNSFAWVDDWYSNRFYLHHQIRLFKELIQHRGYLYLNQIYESLCIEWSPDEDNICYRDPDTFSFDFIQDGDDKIVITIK